MRVKTTGNLELSPRPPLIEKIMERVHKEPYSGCWLWDGPASKKDYGVMTYKGSPSRAVHRLSFFVANGYLPADLFVLHKCDNSRCCNPRHLFLGTNLDNVRDCIAKDRHSRGTRHPSAKLTDAQVVEMRRLRTEEGLKVKDLAARFGMGVAGTAQIVRRERWKHLQ